MTFDDDHHRSLLRGKQQQQQQQQQHYYGGNYTITTSVSIRVTPYYNHFVSWGILWIGFVLVSCIACWQVMKENRYLATARQRAGGAGGGGTTAADVEDDEPALLLPGMSAVVGEGESGVSTADITRSVFRKLLLLAMLSRAALMPVQIWSDPLWWQFAGDTLPEMFFASAWTVLVTFFIQLVGVATGTGTNTSPGIVIQATAYVVYFFLIITQLFNLIATVLLYALMCCIYATLFGIVVYFCPKLLSLLRNSQQELSLRLVICTVVCIMTFSIHTINYAFMVVAPPAKVYWWLNYGLLELFPTIVFLAIMKPTTAKGERDSPSSTPGDPVPSAARTASGGGLRRVESGMRRVDSSSSNTGTAARKAQETTSLLKTAPAYGSAFSGR